MNSDAASPPGEPENRAEHGTNGADRAESTNDFKSLISCF
jgi:hypothetical protein